MSGYLVPSGFGEAEITEKHSRFIGRIWLTETEDEALAHIKEMREKHWDATHNVYAYIIRENGAMRYSDDGEPQGTSGMPTLSVLRSAGLTNVCCVITRYFGGILLGTGGLVRAYSQTAQAALDSAGISRMSLWSRLKIVSPYQLYERVRSETEASGAIIEDSDFAETVTLSVLCDSECSADFTAHLTDITSGKVIPENCGETYRAVPLMK